MTIKSGLITIDTLDAIKLGTWWCEQLDGVVLQELAGQFMMIHSEAAGIVLGFQQVTDPTPGKNRVHIDFQAKDRVGEVDRLIAAGAALIDTGVSPAAEGFPGMTWNVLADPEGNRFCVADQIEG